MYCMQNTVLDTGMMQIEIRHCISLTLSSIKKIQHLWNQGMSYNL